MHTSAANILSSYVDALRPIIYITHFDFMVTDKLIENIKGTAKCVEFNNAFGLLSFEDKHPLQECDLKHFLELTKDDGFERQTFLILKDVHNSLQDPKIIALLKRIAENQLEKDNFNTTVFIVSDTLIIPHELENYITIFDIPLPSIEEIREITEGFIAGLDIEANADTVNNIILSFKGLNEFQIKQILNLAYQNGGNIDSGDRRLVLQEKAQLIKKSGLLELVDFHETIDDIGGLENLKEWLGRKARIFADLDKAIRYGVDIPKGIMIIGMPGCGKSLTAKAAASLFELPLVRLDVGRLLGKYVGESEENMRKALSLAEAISPCVLWVDEIEKAFAGVSNDGGHEVTTRLFGQFLTWIQEKENTVFIVATANDISRLPAEFLRKGRFDELFSVTFPNAFERQRILEIHLKKRKKWRKDINLSPLVKSTEGFSGADLEAVVKETIEKAFWDGKEEITTNDLMNAIEHTNSISQTMKSKIESIKKAIEELNIKPASKDLK